jgi:putative ATP-binding cassette transporter
MENAVALALAVVVVIVGLAQTTLDALQEPGHIETFLATLWGLVQIPGYLVWAALLYAGVGTYLTVKVGRPLVQLNFAGRQFEGDFRFSLARLCENAESIASYGRLGPDVFCLSCREPDYAGWCAI